MRKRWLLQRDQSISKARATSFLVVHSEWPSDVCFRGAKIDWSTVHLGVSSAATGMAKSSGLTYLASTLIGSSAILPTSIGPTTPRSITAVGVGALSATECASLGTSRSVGCGASVRAGSASRPRLASVTGIGSMGSGLGSRALRFCDEWKRRSVRPSGSKKPGTASPILEPGVPSHPYIFDARGGPVAPPGGLGGFVLACSAAAALAAWPGSSLPLNA
mmetsp:Transcript_35767/g.104681  ORF Transcript_35767/g.104681 Transcript_35767/m.104681 type:complete len:219 (+) Transcript_35767:1586-2242(+)